MFPSISVAHTQFILPMTGFPPPTLFFSLVFDFLYFLQYTVCPMRWSTPSQFPDRRINTLYPAQSSITRLRCVLFVKRAPWSEIYGHLIPSPQLSHWGLFLGVCCLVQMIKPTDWRSVCCRDLNQQRCGVGDYYQVLDLVRPEETRQLVLL